MHASPASNALTFTDQNTSAVVGIFPSSVESGAAVIGSFGQLGTLLTLDDVVALRDFLNVCITQAAQASPPAVVEQVYAETGVCIHCDRPIVKDPSDGWIDPEAGTDVEFGDGIWRETCDAHDTYLADHEPPDPCTAAGEHLTGQDHRWQECPTYHDDEA